MYEQEGALAEFIKCSLWAYRLRRIMRNYAHMRSRLAPALATGCALLPIVLYSYSGGPPPGRTAAPNEPTCIDANCHAGTRIDPSDALVLVTSSAMTYVPGSGPQRWSVLLSDPQARAYGFQLSARVGATGAQAGRLRNVDATTQVVCQDSRLAESTGCTPSALLQFLQHNEPRLLGEFAFEWTPPGTDVGEVHVYVAANASVSGQRNARIHTRRFVLRPASSATTARALNAANFSPVISPGSWITILGSGFDGAEVWIGGRKSPVAYSSSTQINVLAPEETAIGTIPIDLRIGDRTTTTLSVTSEVVAPAFFMQGSQVAHTRHGSVFALYGSGFSRSGPAVDRVTIGGIEVQVQFAGVVGPGLFQLNVVVPSLPPGLHSVVAETGGKRTQEAVGLELGP